MGFKTNFLIPDVVLDKFQKVRHHKLNTTRPNDRLNVTICIRSV
jgi:hypothetical protein